MYSYNKFEIVFLKDILNIYFIQSVSKWTLNSFTIYFNNKFLIVFSTMYSYNKSILSRSTFTKPLILIKWIWHPCMSFLIETLSSIGD